MQEIESHVTHAQSMRAEYDALVDDDLVLACVDDFCRLTVRHRVKKAAGGGYDALRAGGSVAAAGLAPGCVPPAAGNYESVDSYDGRPTATKHHKVRRPLEAGARAVRSHL